MSKLTTGIEEFDEISDGSIPRGRTTLVKGGPGCGKTVSALQSLVHAAQHSKQAGSFVAFEENARHIIANAQAYDWDLPALQKRKLFFLGAQRSSSDVKAGEFDLTGMLAIIDAKVRELAPRCLVIDRLSALSVKGARKRAQLASKHRRSHLQSAQANATARLLVVKTQMVARNAEMELLAATGSASTPRKLDQAMMHKLRHADVEGRVPTRSTARRRAAEKCARTDD